MKKIALGLSALAIVAGCGSSGGSGAGGTSGGSGPTAPTVTQFTSFDDLPEDGTVSILGKAVTATYTYNSAGDELTLIDGASSFNDAEIIARLKGGEATRLAFTNTGNDVTFGDDAELTDDGDALFLINGNSGDIAVLVVGSNGQDFSYQNYGA